MSYNDIADMANNGFLQQRIAACVVSEGMTHMHPIAWAAAQQWYLAAAPGWASAWNYAVATDNPEPGRSNSVITDGMILAAVQQRLTIEAAARAEEAARAEAEAQAEYERQTGQTSS